MREAIARSLRDVVPAENSMPLHAALDWSRRDWEREEAEQQRWLLDLAAAQRCTAAAAQPTRGVPVIKLEDSSDDDLYRPRPPHFGDPGQGSNCQRRHRRTAAMTLAMSVATTRGSTTD
jgi:hypothetical protein